MNKYPEVKYASSIHGEEEISAVNEVLRRSTKMGNCVRKFENKVAHIFGKKHGIMVNSGSSALLLAVDLLELPKDSEIITPALLHDIGHLLYDGKDPIYKGEDGHHENLGADYLVLGRPITQASDPLSELISINSSIEKS